MGIMFVLILISLVVAVGFLLAFFRAVRGGQFDDDETPAIRILFDEKLDSSPPSSTKVEG